MIIIIGGTGFVGKHLSILLNSRQIDNVSLSRTPNTEFVEKHAPATRLIPISDLHQKTTLEVMKSASMVVYLASDSIPASQHNSIETELDRNVIPCIETLSNIVNINPDIRIVYLSSGGTVYGPGHSSPICESTELNPVTPYAYGKITIESYLRYLGNTNQASYTILRASNPVGKWHCNKRQGFIGAAIARVKENQPVQVFGTGDTVRDYLDADELVNAILMIYNNRPVSRNKIWNVGSGKGSTLNEIIRSLKSVASVDVKVENLPARETDLAYNVLNCSRIQNELGWTAKLSLYEIIRNAWQHSH